MSQENLVDELIGKLKDELKAWTARLPHYTSMYLIFDQYARQYVNMVDVIDNIKKNGDEVDKDILRFLLKEDNVLEFLIKSKKTIINKKKEEKTA